MQSQTETSLDAWLKELQEATSGGEGMTAREMAARLGKSVKSVTERVLHPAKSAGRLVKTDKWIENLAGVRVQVPAYKIVKAK